MPFGCRTEQKQIDPQTTGGRVTELPWCVEHRRWFFICQHRALPDYPKAPVVDLSQHRKGI
jgi:hypothetical protein